MPLHYILAVEQPASRRLRRGAPLLLLLGMLAGALVPGLIAGDRPFQTSLCDDLEQAPASCGLLERTLSAALRGGGDLVQLDKADGADALSNASAASPNSQATVDSHDTRPSVVENERRS
jgi:hypothetical protein